MRGFARDLLFRALPPILFLSLFGCSDETSLGPAGPPSRHALLLTDTTIALSVVYLPGTKEPSVQLFLNASFRIQSDSAMVIRYAAGIGNVSKQYSPSQTVLTYNSLYSVALSEMFSGISPFVSKPEVSLTAQVRTYVAGKESTMTFLYVTRRDLDWSDVREPDLKEPTIGGSRQVGTGEILWRTDRTGFYFHNVQSSRTVVSFFSIGDSSIVDVTPAGLSSRAYDLTYDNNWILTGADSGAPSGLSLTDAQSFVSTPLFPALDSLLITSAKFSTDDSSIVFTTMNLGSVISQYEVWLFRRSNSAPARITQLSGFLSPSILRWLPTSNDKFAFHTHGNTLYVYSLTDQAITPFPFSSPFFPRQLLDDGFTVLGFRVEEQQGSVTTENHLWKYTIAGQPIRQLTFVKEVVFNFDLSRDGSILVFAADRGGNPKLYLLPVTGLLTKRSPF